MRAVIYSRFGTDRQNESSATDQLTDTGLRRLSVVTFSSVKRCAAVNVAFRKGE
jgi:hypothetical protein